MAKKSIFDMLNQTSKQAIEVKQDSTASNIKMLDIKDLVPSKENFYSTEEIETLKETIEMFGVMQNILVTKIPNSSQYRILAGHRRCMAINRLVEEGKTKFSQVPCLIREPEEEIRARLQLLFANSTMRQLSDWERVEQTRQLKEVLKEYKDLGNALPGRLRDYIASALDVSPTTAGRLEKIDKNLVPELKGSLKNGDIALTTATELAGMSAADQKAVYEQTGGKVKMKDATTVKKESIKPLPTPEITQEYETTMHQRSLEDIENNIYAVKSTMNMLECEIGRIADLKSFDEEQGNLDGAAKRTAHIEYLGELLARVQQDLSDLEN